MADDQPKSLFTELDEMIDRHKAKQNAIKQKEEMRQKEAKRRENPLL